MRRVFRLPFSRNRVERELDDEFAFHLENRIQRLMAVGMSPSHARAEALRQFGDLSAVRDSCLTLDHQRERAMHRANVASEARQDLTYALRTLRRNAVLTAVIVGALATGIGANTAIFTLIDAVLLRNLPVMHPEQLVAVGNPARVGGWSSGNVRLDLLSYPLYRDLAANHDVFTGVLASGRADRLDVRIDANHEELEHPRGRWVSGNYFAVLGVPAARGRTFDTTAASHPGGAPTVVISHGYWTRRFQNDPSVIGRTILIDGTAMSIIGVAPASFTGEIVGTDYDMWLPASMHDIIEPHRRALDQRGESWLLLLGRLKPGVTLAQAERRVPAILQRDIAANTPANLAPDPNNRTASRPQVSAGARGFSWLRDTYQAPLFTLMIGVALLLCIICGNVANLLLARSVARGREMAVRLALGANRARLVRQLLTESALLAVLSAALGLFVAWVGSRGLMYLVSPGGGVKVDTGMDLPVLAFTLAVSVVAVGVFGLVPALRASRVDLASSMRANARSVTGSAGMTRGGRAPVAKLLIAGQVALSVLLLTGATMLVRSLRNLQDTSVGLDRDHLVIVDVDILTDGYVGAPLATLVHTLRDRVAAVPGVRGVTYSENGIFSGTESGTTIEVPGFQMRAPEDSIISYDMAGPNYASGIGATLLQGRDLLPSDENRPARVALINATMADFYWPGERAVGRYLHISDSLVIQVVGVIGDVRDHSLTAPEARRAYFPYAHTDTAAAGFGNPAALRLEVRTAGDPSALVQPIRKAVLGVSATLPIESIDPVVDLMRDSIAEQTLLAQLATGFGVLALLLAGIGLYGVMTYAITRRTGEIGLRVALGAQRADVIRMVLVDALKLVAVGVVVGLPLALLATRLLRAQLHGVGPTDPASMATAVIVLAASAMAAVLVPALRASRLSPMLALRAD
jgi:predicted permease